MTAVEVILRCVGHCVETAARREFERLMGEYFDGKGKLENIEARIELLSDFLNSADFPALRASDPRLSGEVDSVVIIQRNDDQKYTMIFRE